MYVPRGPAEGAVLRCDGARGPDRHNPVHGPSEAVWTSAEWGVCEQSGFGRELGLARPSEYHETKHTWRNARVTHQGWSD